MRSLIRSCPANPAKLVLARLIIAVGADPAAANGFWTLACSEGGPTTMGPDESVISSSVKGSSSGSGVHSRTSSSISFSDSLT